VQTQLEPRAHPPLETAAAGAGVLLDDVSRTHRDRHGNAVAALREVSLRAAPGELLAVVGPSGCGKTTMLELICRLQDPDGGTVRSDPAALMPQHDLLLPWLTAIDNAALALRIARRPREQARERARALLRIASNSSRLRPAPTATQVSGDSAR